MGSKTKACEASGCFMEDGQCRQSTCSPTKYMPLTDATMPKLAPPHRELCAGKCYPWMSFPQYVRETESDSWQFATTGMLSEKCVDLSKGSKTEVGELTKRYVYGRVGATKEVLQLPAGSPCIPQRPSRRDEAPYFDNYASECASTLKCYEMRWQPYKGASYIGQPYLGYGCCRPSSMDDATWEESHLKTKCEYATMEAWFAWRRVDKGVPHYHYACIDKDDGYGHWYLYSEDNHKELVQCPQGVTTVGNKRWCVLGRHWPCKEDYQCESKKCLNEKNAATDKPVRYGKIFQCA